MWRSSRDYHAPGSLDARASEQARSRDGASGSMPGDGPLFVVISRLTWQKGMDVLVDVIDHLVGLGGRLALLGPGDAAVEAGFASRRGAPSGPRRHPHRL